MKKILLLWISIMILIGVKITAQSTGNLLQESRLELTVNIQSSFYSRGSVLATKPVLMGDMSYALDQNKKWRAGVWGAVEFGNESNGTQYKQMDYYLRYFHNRFYIGIFDSYSFGNINTAIVADDIFNYSRKRTNHFVTLATHYTFAENFPLNIKTYIIFYGGANLGEVLLKSNGEYAKNKYSTYLQLSCPIIQGKIINLSTFLGGAFAINGGNSLYGDGKNRFQIVNVGLEANKKIKISEYYAVPFTMTTIWNPTLKYGGIQFGATIF